MKVIESAGGRVLSTKHQASRERSALDPSYSVPSKTLHPFYKGDHEENSLFAPAHVGRVERSTPRVLHRDNNEPQASLVRRDVAGAMPQRFKGTLPFNIYDEPQVTPYSLGGLDISDIEGTQPGTRKPGTKI